jgi:uncharacterized tellurite resistance protein B-like protein
MDDEYVPDDEGGPIPEADLPHDLMNKFDRVVEQHFAAQEREAAHELLRDHFHLLPEELQHLYEDVQALYKAHKFEESAKLFEQWMDMAKKMGLI